ncbi:MAG: hypothetical protein ABI867_13305 [Kofleriaceae bacterium]
MLISRSSPECHLYIELHPCTCGETTLPPKHRLVSSDDGLMAVYEAPCPRCGTPRRFDFVLDPEIPPGMKFGGARPSQIIDAAQFLAVADAAAKSVPANVPEADKPAARYWMSRAVDALEEVVKFIPAGADRVPVEALFTTTGKELYLVEPGRFRKLRLEAVLGVYRDLLARL